MYRKKVSMASQWVSGVNFNSRCDFEKKLLSHYLTKFTELPGMYIYELQLL